MERVTMMAPTGVEHSREKNVILCVDDNPQMLALMDAYLTSHDYIVLTASDRDATLKLFLNNRVDAIVTDFELGEITGEDVILSLRSLKPGIPALVFSGSEDLPSTLLTLADACIHKSAVGTLPSKLAELLNPCRADRLSVAGDTVSRDPSNS